MNRDFKELLCIFNARGVEFIVVGAHALAAHGHVRATKVLDIWIRPSLANAEKVLVALEEFHAPLFDLTIQDLLSPDLVFQIGVAPVRIDILTAIDGVDFDQAWESRHQTTFDKEPAAVLSVEHIIQNKRKAGRPQDLADVAWLVTKFRKG